MADVSVAIILHDIARVHTADSVKALLCCLRMELVEHPTFSPDMGPCNYDLFARKKEPLRGTCYNIGEEVIHDVVLSLMVACVLFWVKMRYYEFLVLWHNAEYYVSKHYR
jgi:hypothetical protein